MPPTESPAPGQPPSSVLRFGCPACLGELSIPEALAGIEGPCPLCQRKIVAPNPSHGMPARLAVAPAPVPSAPPAQPPPPQTPPQVQQPPQATSPSLRRVHCSACNAALDVDPNLNISGGPCPICQTWINLSGQAATEAFPVPSPPTQAPPPPPAAAAEAAPQPSPAPPSSRRRRRPGASPNINEPDEDDDFQEPEESHGQSGERRRVKKRKKRRVLPDACYVGAAQRDPRDGPDESSHGRTKTRRRKGVRLDGNDDPAVSRWLPVVFGILIPLIAGMLLALKMGWINPQDLRFWESKRSGSTPSDHEGLVHELQITRSEMNQKEGAAYDAVEASIHGFLNSETWEEAETYLLAEAVPENSEALSFLKVFPREEFRDCAIKVIQWSRIPNTDRWVFTTQLAVPNEDSGGEKLTFMIAEQLESGKVGIHALQLYQSWKQTLTEFLETPGASDGRFYALVQLHSGSGASPITLPDDGEYVRLRLQDNFVSHFWTTDAYVRKDSYPGIRFDTKLSPSTWAYVILDLEWRQGPAGDSFVNVKGLHSSNWGDFHR